MTVRPHSPVAGSAATLEADWMPRFACPECKRRLAPELFNELACVPCGLEFPWSDGVVTALAPARAASIAPFLQQYRRVRGAEGYRSASPDFYRCLPYVPANHPHAVEWGLRRESFSNFHRHALPSSWAGPLRVLDVGAGCGWLSHRLAAVGHHAVAVDCLVDDEDGLRACRHYPVRILPVQAHFDHLPFESGQFDVIVFNGSVHYSPDPGETITAATRLLVAGGTLAIMDSPTFVRAADGETMTTDLLARLAADHQLDQPVRAGQGYVTFSGVEEACERAGLKATFARSRGVLPWRVRRQFARLKLRRAPAAFGVWVAR